MKNSLNLLVAHLLRKNKISFDKDELAFQIESHPSYPSLHAITGVLNHFNIENVAAEVPVSKEVLEQLPAVYLAQIRDDNGERLVVVETKEGSFYISQDDGKSKKYSLDEFLKLFTGILVAVEKTENEYVPEKKNTLGFLEYLIFGVMILSGVFWLATNYTSILGLSHLLLSVVGVVISLAIVEQEFGLQNSIGNAFCSAVDDKRDCDAVLTSKGAEIFKGYKLSDLSLIYFVALIGITLIEIQHPQLSLVLSYASLPIVLYSIYYQYAVIKKWCLLCLSIVAILLLQGVVAYNVIGVSFEFEWTALVFLGLIVPISMLGWRFIKTHVKELVTLRKEKISSVKFKRNFELFDSLLNKSIRKETYIKDSQELTFGNINANLEIVVVTNPFCGHCKPVHKQMKEILQKYPDLVTVKFRFNANTGDLESDMVKITNRLLEIYHERGKETCLIAMNEIYEDTDAKMWLKNWGTGSNLFIEELEREKEWCANNGINFTPEILVNGKSYPKEYERSDLQYFIEELEEKQEILK